MPPMGVSHLELEARMPALPVVIASPKPIAAKKVAVVATGSKAKGPAVGVAASTGSGGGGGGSNLTVLFSEKGRCHFCRLLCPDVDTLRHHLETVHQPPRHALCWNCENFFHICAIQRHRVKCRETYQSEKK